jgi:hypothetical protein
MINVNLTLTSAEAKVLAHFFLNPQAAIDSILENGNSSKDALKAVAKEIGTNLFDASGLKKALEANNIDPFTVSELLGTADLDGYMVNIFNDHIVIQGYNVTASELRAVYDFIKAGTIPEDFYVEVNPATSRILQNIAFASGWTWKTHGQTVESLDRKYIRFNAKGYIAATDTPKTENRKSFDDAIVYASKPKIIAPVVAGFTVSVNDKSQIEAGCVMVSFASLITVMQKMNLR